MHGGIFTSNLQMNLVTVKEAFIIVQTLPNSIKP